MRGGVILLAAGVAGASSPALAIRPINIADYDCARTDDGRTVAGAELFKQGFEIQSVGRFGEAPNVMMIHPKTKVRANCFERQGGSR